MLEREDAPTPSADGGAFIAFVCVLEPPPFAASSSSRMLHAPTTTVAASTQLPAEYVATSNDCPRDESMDILSVRVRTTQEKKKKTKKSTRWVVEGNTIFLTNDTDSIGQLAKRFLILRCGFEVHVFYLEGERLFVLCTSETF